MATKKTKFKLERDEYHQVLVTYSLEVALGDQDAWTQLREMAIETGDVDESDFPEKASKRIEDWQVLYMKAGDGVKDISKHLTDRWLSEEQGAVLLL